MGAVSEWFHRAIGAVKNKQPNRGQTAERMAERYLRRKGLKLLERNYRTKAGEIDLIMQHADDWVFVEVRYKHSDDWVSPAESITVQKQRKVIKAAQQYLLKHDKQGQKSGRFDVILMSGDLKSPDIEWLQHAFY